MFQFSDYNLPILIVSFIFFLVGAYFLIEAAMKIQDKFRSAILFIFLAFLLHFVGDFLNLYLISIGLDTTSILWIISPLLNLLEAGALMYGAWKFYIALEK